MGTRFAQVIFVLFFFYLGANGKLVAYYNFENATSSNVPVQQGYCPPRSDVHPGTWTGNVALTTGKFGQGVLLSNIKGDIEYVDLGNWKINSQRNQLSITAWINTTSASVGGVATNPRIVSKESSTVVWMLGQTQGAGPVWLLQAAVLFQGSSSPTILTAPPSVTIPSSNWTHVGMTFDGSTLTLYQNGAAIASYSPSSAQFIDESPNNVSIAVGNSGINANNGYNGVIDEVKIFDNALSASEMYNLATQTGPNLPPVFNSTSSSTNPTQIPGGSFYLLPSPPVIDSQLPASQLEFSWQIVSGGCSGVKMVNTSAMDVEVELTEVQSYAFQVTARDYELCASTNVYVTAVAVPPAINLSAFMNGTVNVEEGTSATFTVDIISGFPTPDIQWQQLMTNGSTQNGNTSSANWQAIAGATNAEFTTPIATSELDGVEYRVLVRNFVGFYISEPIVISFVPINSQTTTTTSSSGASGGSGDGATVGIILGTLSGALALCLLAACAVAVFIFFKRQKNYRRLKLVKPDFEPLTYGDRLEEPQLKKSRKAKLEELEELLLRPDNQLLFAITETTQPEDQHTLCPALVYVYESHGRSYNLLEKFISLEVASSDDEGTLFRSDSLAMKLFQPYSRIFGSEWLWNTLALPLNELNNLNAETEEELSTSDPAAGGSLLAMSLEIDPRKMEDASETEVNTLELWLIAQKLFSRMVKAQSTIPSEIRHVLKHVDQEISQAFPNARYSAMGGFLFLRFICPAMLIPHAYGLLSAPPHSKTQRQIILLAKVLQNLANGTMPGEKEGYMERMNMFISNNQTAMYSFFDKLTQNDGPEAGRTIPEAVKWNALNDIYEIVSSYHQQIDKHLQSVEEGEEIRAQLNNVLQGAATSRRSTRSKVEV